MVLLLLSSRILLASHPIAAYRHQANGWRVAVRGAIILAVPAGNEWVLGNVWRPPGSGEPRTTVLRHPDYPYDDLWATDDPADLIAIAAQYLFKTQAAFEVGALLDSGGMFTVPLAWLPVPTLPVAPGSPVPLTASGWSTRFDASTTGPAVVDRTAAILAVQSAVPNDPATALGSRLGIRILTHVEPNASPPRNVRIVGVATSPELAQAVGAHPAAANAMFQLFFGIGHGRFRLDLLDAVRTVGRLGNAQLAIDGFRVRATAGSQALVDVYLNASRPPGQPYGPGYAVTASLSVGASGIPDVEAVEQVRHVAHAVLAKVFPRDPASQAGPTAIVDARPNRAPDRLTNYWQGAALPGLPGTSASWTPLTDDLVQVDVLQSRLADPAADETKTTSVVPICIPHPRTNWFAALSAYQHARGLFDTMRGYGLLPETFFRFASLPLHIRYRAPIDPGPGRDGRTVNAQVDYDPPDHDMVGMGATSPPSLKPLQVRFALGDLRRSWSRREPLGLSTDERWSWHEYCHVLLAAATGALELPFSHSAGDALAAIMGDPDSALSVNQERRGLTFPWVYLHRCHDRSVFNGWSWSGRLHRQARFTTNSNRRHKGYESEQIMSTSLFRLYRALGGDTVSDRVVRKRAANYTAYLVMRAIDLLGPAALMPADTPGDFVLALIAADTGTLPVSSGPLAERVGGWAAKVVGWAFEAQGLDARRDPLDVFDAPGEPPEVDIYVDNGRPDSEGAHPRGGYMPVPLDWNTGGQPSVWHASPNGITVTGSTATVEVQNRGSNQATAVTVNMWRITWPTSSANPPKWDRATWTQLTTPPTQNIPAGGMTTFGFSGLPTATGRYLLLAESTCAADRSNIDPATTLPTASLPTPIVDLVAGDNNLGLRLLTV
jgi:hypothetical protein